MKNNVKIVRGSVVLKNRLLLYWFTFFLVLLCMPLLSPSRYLYRVMTMIGIYSILALGLNFTSGYLGLISIGHAGFYSIGAYTAAILTTKVGIDFFIATPAAIFVTALVGFIFGVITLKISGTYLAITTLGFVELIRVIMKNWESVTNGSYGIQRIGRPVFFGVSLSTMNGGIYYLVVIALLLSILLCYLLDKGKFGRTLKAMRDDELVSSLMGISIKRYRVIAFAISGAFAGFAGSAYAHLNGYIDPNIFTLDTSITILCIVILGGMGSIPGMIIGAIIVISFPELFRFLSEYRYVVYGLVLIIMMRFRPQGILGGRSKKPFKFPRGIEFTNEKRSMIDGVARN